jgi:hypothetical protein
MRTITTATLALMLATGAITTAAPSISQAEVAVSFRVGFAPPVLPVYAQPPVPGYGYIWTPGYWAWSNYDNNYYWVPGAWVLPPRIGYLWTPPYWAFDGGVYVFRAGYWGPTVGYYGGINYGFGYGGFGYEGGYWRGREFFYNQRVNNFGNVHITNVYDRPVAYAAAASRVSFSGGHGARPTSPAYGREGNGQFAGREEYRRSSFAPPAAVQARPGQAFAGRPYANEGARPPAAAGPAPHERQGEPNGRPEHRERPERG